MSPNNFTGNAHNKLYSIYNSLLFACFLLQTCRIHAENGFYQLQVSYKYISIFYNTNLEKGGESLLGEKHKSACTTQHLDTVNQLFPVSQT